MSYRKSYKPYRKNYYSNKKKWAPFMYDITPTTFTVGPQVIDGSFVTLVSNAVETNVPTPTILKVKHLKVALDFKFDASVLCGGFCCLMFIPQGLTPSATLVTQHPEWVMSWKNVRNDVTATHHEQLITTHLMRNLNSGDKIVCYFSFYNSAVGPTSFTVTGKFSGVVRNN